MERPADGRERLGQRWVLATSHDGGYGVELANDAKYSYAADGSTLYLTALRSPAFAHHDPYVLQPDGEYCYTDQGEQQFTLRLLARSSIGALDAY
jgi:alpha-mannosidase